MKNNLEALHRDKELQEFQKEMEAVLNQYGQLVREKLIECPVTEGFYRFLEKISSTRRKIVVSGGLQDEIREVFHERNLAYYFNGIYGA